MYEKCDLTPGNLDHGLPGDVGVGFGLRHAAAYGHCSSSGGYRCSPVPRGDDGRVNTPRPDRHQGSHQLTPSVTECGESRQIQGLLNLPAFAWIGPDFGSRKLYHLA